MRWFGLVLGGCAWISAADEGARWDLDQDGVERPADCNDDDPAVSPRAQEICDPSDRDEDCDGEADDADPTAAGGSQVCRDVDRDGSGDPATATVRCDPDAGWVAVCTDCDDRDPTDRCATTTTVPTTLAGCTGPPTATLRLSDPAAEIGATFLADASASLGQSPVYRFDWGDGSPVGSTASHAYTSSGFFAITLEVEDPCGVSVTQVWVAVSELGRLLTVTTAEDEGQPEVLGQGWLGDGLSLREALVLANATDGAEVVTFDHNIGTAFTGPDMPAMEDPGGVLIGAGVVIDGSHDGIVRVKGSAGVVAGLELTGFTDEKGALHLDAEGATARGVVVRNSLLGVRMSAPGTLLLDATVRDGTGPGEPLVVVSDEGIGATLLRVDAADGLGKGLSIRADDVTIALCTVHGNTETGIQVKDDADDLAILDSSVVGNGESGVEVEDDQLITGLDLRNVILAHNGRWGLAGEVVGFAADSPAFVLWWDNGWGSCEACDDLGPGAIDDRDPELSDWQNGDLTPSSTSPAIDAGTPTGIDRNGPAAGSWLGSAPDLGAVEVR